MSPLSAAKKRANKKWNDQNLNIKYDHIHLVLPVGYKIKLKLAAEEYGEKVNEYIRKAIDERMK